MKELIEKLKHECNSVDVYSHRNNIHLDKHFRFIGNDRDSYYNIHNGCEKIVVSIRDENIDAEIYLIYAHFSYSRLDKLETSYGNSIQVLLREVYSPEEIDALIEKVIKNINNALIKYRKEKTTYLYKALNVDFSVVGEPTDTVDQNKRKIRKLDD